MASDYDDSHPTTKDKIRALIPDTVTGQMHLSNEQINQALVNNNQDFNYALAECLDIIGSLLSNKARSYTIKGVSYSVDGGYIYRQRAEAIRKRADKDDSYQDLSAYDYNVTRFGEDITEFIE